MLKFSVLNLLIRSWSKIILSPFVFHKSILNRFISELSDGVGYFIDVGSIMEADVIFFLQPRPEQCSRSTFHVVLERVVSGRFGFDSAAEVETVDVVYCFSDT